MIATVDTAGRPEAGGLTVTDLKPVFFNGQSDTKSDLDVLMHIATQGRDSIEEQLSSNDALLARYQGSKRKLRAEVKTLLDQSRDEVQTISASKEFKNKNKGIFKRIGSYLGKHKLLTALLIIAAVGGGVAGGYYLAGNWELMLTQLGTMRRGLATAVGNPLNVLEVASDPALSQAVEVMPGGTPMAL